MAPVEVEHEPRLFPLVLAGLHVVVTAYASYTVLRSLYRSHKALGPAQDTRHRRAQRIKLTIAFASLAALGLVFAATSCWDHLNLSYRSWASERKIKVPDSFFGNRTSSTNDKKNAGFHLRRWLSDTPILRDGLEIVAESARRYWWGQQLDVATVSWTTMLAIEGRRRRIPHLWAYAVLPHLVSLSFAQNLFYVALLQTPSPIPSEETRLAQALYRMLPEKPKNWFPKPAVYVVPIVLNYLIMGMLPFVAGTPSFTPVVLLTKLLTLAPLILPAIAPFSWGAVHADPRDAYPQITRLFNFISVVNAVSHITTTVGALSDKNLLPWRHRHSLKDVLDPKKILKGQITPKMRRYIKREGALVEWERTATRVAKVLASMTDHPAASAVGKDVLLSALSLGLWAAVRGTDVGDMLRAVWPTVPSGKETSGSHGTARVKAESPSDEPKSTTAADTATPGSSMTLRRRGRSKKNMSVSSFGSSVGSADDTATSTTAQPTPRRRGRPRKVKAEPEPEPELETEEDGVEQQEEDDKTYEPTPAVKAEVGLGDVLPEEDFDWEAAALAWGLTVVGGLGLGSSAVFGAECVSR